jgi:hypothetical protein
MGFWWGQTGVYKELVSLATTQVSQFLKLVENGVLGDYPYDAVVTPEYVDHDTPRFDNRVLPVWRDRYAYPEITVSSPETFFTYIEGKYAAQIPELRGDLNNYSADYSSIDPESQGWKREASRLLPATEGLAVIVGSRAPEKLLNPGVVERAYTRMFDYDEHCWPTLPVVSDPQLFNANWVKKHEARRVLDITRALHADAAAAFAGNIATGEGEHVAIFNPLAHARSDLAVLKGEIGALVDVATGERFTSQRRDGGDSVFLARDVPAFGYRLYRVERAAASSDLLAAPAAPAVAADATSLTSPFYKITFDPATGAIRSILDRELNRELVDPAAPHQANQLIYIQAKARESKELTQHLVTAPQRHETKVGPVQASYTVWFDDAKTGAAIRQIVTVYAGVKRIDIVNQLEHARVLAVSHQERYKNNFFYAFPWKVEGGQFRVEYPGGVVRPFLDQLRWGSHDYLHANRWVDTSNAEFGITVAPWNAANFHFGEIRYNQLANDYQPKGSWLFSYAWSDRMSGLITLSAEDCNATFGYSITSHRGDWNRGATTAFGWNVASPLAAIALPARQNGAWKTPAKSFLSVDAPNVQLTVLKAGVQPGGGWIARLVETDGSESHVTLDATAFGIDAAALCNIVEDDLEPLAVQSGKLSMKLRPFGMVTLRLLAGVKPSAVSGFAARAASDSEVALSWERAPGVVYNLYRSDDPDAPASDTTLVARVAGATFNDRGLNPRTPYYYRLAALSPGNRQGPLSARVAVTTSTENRTPPQPVAEMGVIRRTPTSAFLYWRRSPEPDVAKHFVYRSDTPNFDPAKLQPVATFAPNPHHFLQVYLDEAMTPGNAYHYRVLSEDWSGNRQTVSPEVAVTAPRS